MGMTCKTRLDHVQTCPKCFDSVDPKRLAVSVMRSALAAKMQNKLRFQHSPDRMAPQTMIVSSALSPRLLMNFWTTQTDETIQTTFKLLQIDCYWASKTIRAIMLGDALVPFSLSIRLWATWHTAIFEAPWSFWWDHGWICGYFSRMATVKPVNPANVSITSGPKMTASSNLAAFASIP